MVMGVVSRRHLPRGIRNNNPGNIRRNAIEWEGMQAIQHDKDFVQFSSPKYGFRAMAKVLRSYERRGLVTVSQIISTYAPSTENHTANYIKFVADRLQLEPNTPLTLSAKLFQLVKAITVFENGVLFADYYADSAIQEGIELA